jgi:hypothetical protein
MNELVLGALISGAAVFAYTKLFSVTKIFPTYNLDVDTYILSSIDRKILGNLIVNRYTRRLLENPSFWKMRLENYLKLKCDYPGFDYKFAVKFLDNDRLFEYDYYEACDKEYSQIRQLLKDNNRMPRITISLGLIDGNIKIENIDFYKVFVLNKDKPFEDFINIVSRELKLSHSDLNRIVIMPNNEITSYLGGKKSGTITLINNPTLGQVLYTFVKAIRII